MLCLNDDELRVLSRLVGLFLQRVLLLPFLVVSKYPHEGLLNISCVLQGSSGRRLLDTVIVCEFTEVVIVDQVH